jgi:hypothetical protein
LVTLALACGDGGPGSPGAADDGPCELQAPLVATHRDWPDGGHELWVRVGCQAGRLATPDEVEGARLSADLPGDATIELRDASPGVGTTVVVMRPGAGSTARIQDIAERFMKLRPADERIALYGWGEQLVQLSDLRSSRAELSALLRRLDRLQREGEAAPTEATLTDLFGRAARARWW